MGFGEDLERLVVAAEGIERLGERKQLAMTFWPFAHASHGLHQQPPCGFGVAVALRHRSARHQQLLAEVGSCLIGDDLLEQGIGLRHSVQALEDLHDGQRRPQRRGRVQHQPRECFLGVCIRAEVHQQLSDVREQFLIEIVEIAPICERSERAIRLQ